MPNLLTHEKLSWAGDQALGLASSDSTFDDDGGGLTLGDCGGPTLGDCGGPALGDDRAGDSSFSLTDPEAGCADGPAIGPAAQATGAICRPAESAPRLTRIRSEFLWPDGNPDGHSDGHADGQADRHIDQLADGHADHATEHAETAYLEPAAVPHLTRRMTLLGPLPRRPPPPIPTGQLEATNQHQPLAQVASPNLPPAPAGPVPGRTPPPIPSRANRPNLGAVALMVGKH